MLVISFVVLAFHATVPHAPGYCRYFTYTLMEESLRFSETGAAFLTDLMSKHAMHAGGAEEVFFAGKLQTG